MAQAHPFRSAAGSVGVAPRLARRQVARSRLLVLLAALISFFVSVLLWFSGHESQGIFVGLWVPSILSLGAVVLPRGQR